jgi:hypothetical protein
MYNPTAQFNKRLLELKDSYFLNTFKRVNWDEIISSLLTQEGVAVTTDPSRWNLDTPGYNEIYALWQQAIMADGDKVITWKVRELPEAVPCGSTCL